MKITLAGIDSELLLWWLDEFSDVPDVEVRRGSIVDLKCDAVVSPANSFGFMNGGVDAAYMQRFPRIEAHVRHVIKKEYAGEMLVGQAKVVRTCDENIPHLIIAPTMRVPMTLPRTTVNPYLACRAALRLAKGDGFEHVAFPGMGTGYGRVSPRVCAFQMRAAYDEVIGGKLPNLTDAAFAMDCHRELCLLPVEHDLVGVAD